MTRKNATLVTLALPRLQPAIPTMKTNQDFHGGRDDGGGRGGYGSSKRLRLVQAAESSAAETSTLESFDPRSSNPRSSSVSPGESCGKGPLLQQCAPPSEKP
ncbi:hypothetical protein MRX96_033507 [Rhipicephalus microplus]